jgi:speckle-type POZ protein
MLTFKHPSVCTYPLFIGRGEARDSQAPSLWIVECNITVYRDLKPIHLPTSDIRKYLDNLLQSQAGADVTFTVCGESFAAHKNILSARSPFSRPSSLGRWWRRTPSVLKSRIWTLKFLRPCVRNRMLVLRGGGGELGNLKP